MVTERDAYRAYYTKSAPLVEYMVNQLELRDGLAVLEPAAGDGVFVDAILARKHQVTLDLFELNSEAYAVLCQKYGALSGVQINLEDTLLSPELLLAANFGGRYDRIIANPPYGGWQDYAKRKRLKNLYPNFYVKETYALFLARCIGLLREGGRLVFIIPDTWLNLHLHSHLREYLLRFTKIQEISLFPSHFFPQVNFGYANLSVVVLEKCGRLRACLANRFVARKGFKRVEELSEGAAQQLEFSQQEILDNLNQAFFIGGNRGLAAFINQADVRIGDIADCVTGFYSGNDKKYLRPVASSAKNAKNYQLLAPEFISDDYLAQPALIDGIAGPQCFLPIVKGGKAKYYKPDLWCMEWSKEAVNHYKNDAKARFQNPSYYFRFGLGAPMVTSGDISAALIERKLFDQSIVGIFPKDEAWVYYLLAFFNSPVCSRLIRAINPSANNSANYIKKIPFIKPLASVLAEVTELYLFRKRISPQRHTGAHRVLDLWFSLCASVCLCGKFFFLKCITKGMVTQIKATGDYAPSDEAKLHAIFAELYQDKAIRPDAKTPATVSRKTFHATSITTN